MAIQFLSRTAGALMLSLIAGCGIGTELDASNIGSYDFNYFDIEKLCTAQRERSGQLSLECKDKRLSPISRSCSGFIDGGLDSAKLNCSGDLYVVHQRCKVEMRGADWGELNCKV
ncbi:hypothetical protein [Bermanella sp. R86510]|uniref:hypothetical protein n=1 Tax=unclassified Bermanella TaxID=2627862 RepID=UPI0037CA5F8D